MPRTREFDPEIVLNAALELFWHKGYKGCSMAEVVKKSGVARYGLYQTFTDKDQLYYATLRRYHQHLHDVFVKPFCGQRGDFSSLKQHFERLLTELDKGQNGGCFAHQAAIERGAEDPIVRKIVNDIFEDTKRSYRRIIENGIADGDIRELPVEDLVNYVMGMQRALIAMSKQRCSHQEQRDYTRCALELLRP